MADILLIEPDLILAKTYQQALAHEGHRVKVCAGAQSGILAADQHAPELVILELQLVEHSGVEFLYEFRSYPEWQNVPVVVHSNVPPGEFSESWRLLKNELGVAAYLYKPRASLRELLNQISQLTPVKK